MHVWKCRAAWREKFDFSKLGSFQSCYIQIKSQIWVFLPCVAHISAEYLFNLVGENTLRYWPFFCFSTLQIISQQKPDSSCTLKWHPAGTFLLSGVGTAGVFTCHRAPRWAELKSTADNMKQVTRRTRTSVKMRFFCVVSWIKREFCCTSAPGVSN